MPQYHRVTERSSGLLTGTLTDEEGVAVAGSALSQAKYWLYKEDGGATVNSRDGSNALNGAVTVDAQGAVRVVLEPADNQILGTDPSEVHVAVVQFAWAGGAKQLTWKFRKIMVENIVPVT